MKSKCHRSFWDRYQALPETTQKLADKCFELWRANHSHPSLHFKPIGKDVGSVRIGLYYRAVGYRDVDEILWFWIGPHSEYDRLLK